MDDADWSPKTLTEAREHIDAVDAAILDLLHRRASIVEHVGRLKRESADTPPANAFRPAREIQMLRRMRGETNAPLAFATVVAVWREIVSGFTAAQMPLRVATLPETALLARDNFGAQARIKMYQTQDQITAALARDPAIIALLPIESNWPDAVTGGARVIAALPFCGPETHAYCIGHTALEPSGDDITLSRSGPDASITATDGYHPEQPGLLGIHPRPLTDEAQS